MDLVTSTIFNQSSPEAFADGSDVMSALDVGMQMQCTYAIKFYFFENRKTYQCLASFQKVMEKAVPDNINEHMSSLCLTTQTNMASLHGNPVSPS